MIDHETHAQPEKRIDTATEVRLRITQTLASRTRRQGTFAATIEDELKCAGDRVWALMKQRPLVGVAVTGGVGLALASVVGVGEITLTFVVGYAVYRVLREGVPPTMVADEIMSTLERT